MYIPRKQLLVDQAKHVHFLGLICTCNAYLLCTLAYCDAYVCAPTFNSYKSCLLFGLRSDSLLTCPSIIPGRTASSSGLVYLLPSGKKESINFLCSQLSNSLILTLYLSQCTTFRIVRRWLVINNNNLIARRFREPLNALRPMAFQLC